MESPPASHLLSSSSPALLLDIRFASTLHVGRQRSSNREIQQLPFPADIWALLVTIYENYK